jgi:hypothetical protein
MCEREVCVSGSEERKCKNFYSDFISFLWKHSGLELQWTVDEKGKQVTKTTLAPGVKETTRILMYRDGLFIRSFNPVDPKSSIDIKYREFCSIVSQLSIDQFEVQFVLCNSFFGCVFPPALTHVVVKAQKAKGAYQYPLPNFIPSTWTMERDGKTITSPRFTVKQVLSDGDLAMGMWRNHGFTEESWNVFAFLKLMEALDD